MNKMLQRRGVLAAMLAAGALTVVAACTSMQETVYSQSVALSGANEVPAVTSAAAGTGTVTINADRTVAASITATGMNATAAHIHEAAAGANGPVIVPFTKTGDNTFAAPAGAMLTESQYASYKAGKLYVNVHSAAHPGGEIRAQLKPM
jgi:hypothetical protein